MQNRANQRVPQVVFKTRENGKFVDVTTDEIFRGRTVVVFSFTPACSFTHLPSYNELAMGLLMKKGCW